MWVISSARHIHCGATWFPGVPGPTFRHSGWEGLGAALSSAWGCELVLWSGRPAPEAFQTFCQSFWSGWAESHAQQSEGGAVTPLLCFGGGKSDTRVSKTLHPTDVPGHTAPRSRLCTSGLLVCGYYLGTTGMNSVCQGQVPGRPSLSPFPITIRFPVIKPCRFPYNP